MVVVSLVDKGLSGKVLIGKELIDSSIVLQNTCGASVFVVVVVVVVRFNRGVDFLFSNPNS